MISKYSEPHHTLQQVRAQSSPYIHLLEKNFDQYHSIDDELFMALALKTNATYIHLRIMCVCVCVCVCVHVRVRERVRTPDSARGGTMADYN